MNSLDPFIKAWDIVERRDFASYIFQYPPMAVWRKNWTNDSIAKAWKRALKVRPEAGLYVHIPFCATKCSFCRWLVVEENSPETYWNYARRLALEMSLWAPIFKCAQVTSLYFGGGTPSILPADQLDFLFKNLRDHFHLRENLPVAFEANPSSLDAQKLRVLVRNGVTRLTIGVQSLDDAVVSKSRRAQENSKVRSIYQKARRAGVPYINLDLMSGLEGQSAESFLSTLQEVLSWRPDMVHINPFAPTPFTKFSQNGGRLTLADARARAYIGGRTSRILGESAYRSIAYDAWGLSDEARNYHLEDTVIHGTPLLGLGTGAVSHATGYLRSVNVPGLKSHDLMVSQGRFPIFSACRMNQNHEMRSYLLNHFWYGSFSEADFIARFPEGLGARLKKSLERLAASGVVTPPANGDGIWRVRNISVPDWSHPTSLSQLRIRREFFGSKTIRNLLHHETSPTRELVS